MEKYIKTVLQWVKEIAFSIKIARQDRAQRILKQTIEKMRSDPNFRDTNYDDRR